LTTFAQPFHDYEILDRVGGGAMGTVFKARHKRLNRIVALKVLKPSLARDKRYVERLRREARIVASLSHPHIVTGYDLGEEGGYHFFVMEFVEGKSLRQLLVEWGMFAEEYVLRVAREVAEALHHAYQRDVIHRDIKPANILIDESGNVKLTDMGLAKGPADLTLTRDGATVGTPMYISPEQARNPQDVDVRSDLYSLGATLYHMATGVPPFSGDTMAELITNVLNENVVPPDEANSAVSANVSLVIRKLLAKNLTLRYQTPRELLDDLDRIENAQPPAVDVGRLESDTYEANAWARPVFWTMAAMLLAAVALWVGLEWREPPDAAPTADEFLEQLDQDLRRLPTPGERFARLQTIVDAPTGSALLLEQRRKVIANELQAAVDGVVDEVLGARWAGLRTWINDATVWPDRAQFEREHLQPALRERAGIVLAQLPARVRPHGVEELRRVVDRALAARDGALAAQFEQFLTTVLPARAEQRLRATDFAGADRLWRDALPTFCDGVQRPLPEQLQDDARARMQQRLQLAHSDARRAILAAQAEVVDALRAEADATTGHLRDRLADGADPVAIAEALRGLRKDLGQYWPPSENFTVGADPWPQVEQLLMVAQQAVDTALAEADARRFDVRCDLAWRLFCHGRPADAMAALADSEPANPTQQQALAGHLRVLRAAEQVEKALLAAIARLDRAPVALRLGGGPEPYELRVQPDGEGLRLSGQPVGGAPRTMRFTELRMDDLLRQLGPDAPALRAVPMTTRLLGQVVLRLVGDDAAGSEQQIAGLPAAERAFVLDQVWPRIERVRDQQHAQPLDREQRFDNLERVLAQEGNAGLTELQKAIQLCSDRPDDELSAKELRVLRRARARLRLWLRRRDVRDELARTAPTGAEVDVRVDGADLVAAVAMPAATLPRGEGWQLVGERLEFARGGRPFSEQPLLVLRADAGFGVTPTQTQVACDLLLPTSTVGRRFYLLEFRGVTCALVISRDDAVHACLVEGSRDPLEEDRAQRAFEQALLPESVTPRALAIAGVSHEVTIDVAVTGARTQAMVEVTFDGKQLLRELHKVDASRPPTFALHPLQDVQVERVTVRAFDL